MGDKKKAETAVRIFINMCFSWQNFDASKTWQVTANRGSLDVLAASPLPQVTDVQSEHVTFDSWSKRVLRQRRVSLFFFSCEHRESLLGNLRKTQTEADLRSCQWVTVRQTRPIFTVEKKKIEKKWQRDRRVNKPWCVCGVSPSEVNCFISGSNPGLLSDEHSYREQERPAATPVPK